MKRKFLVLALVGAVLLSAGLVLAAPAASNPAKPTIGGPISSLPFTITGPGYYYLTGSLSYSGTSDGITVTSNDVTIDLGGWCLIGTGSNSGTGIMIGNGSKPGFYSVEVRNGSLSGWSAGVETFFGGSNRALNLRVEKCSNGILLGASLVKDCSCDTGGAGIGISNTGVTTSNAVTNCTEGIIGSGVISGNYVMGCSSNGIRWNEGSIIGNTVAASTTGINVQTSGPCLVTQNTVSGTENPFVGGAATVNVNNAGF